MEYSERVAFEQLSTTANELYLSREIPRVSSLTSVEFLRDYVSKNVPVIFTDIADKWSACEKWDIPYLLSQLGDKPVTVSQTPNGRADAVLDVSSVPYPFLDESAVKKKLKALFVMPHDQVMPFRQFVELLHRSKTTPEAPINYVQFQNSNFTSQFQPLLQDIDWTSLRFAAEAFGCEPDAVNFWMGENRSVSSLHKDHYENLYAVIKGTKRFTLFPPTDRPLLPHRQYHSSNFAPLDSDASQENTTDALLSRKFGIANVSEEPAVPWITLDPDQEDEAVFAKAIRCEIREGELLYLPSLWFHQVSQREDEEGKVIAVNCWFDMQYDIKYNYFTFLDELSRQHE